MKSTQSIAMKNLFRLISAVAAMALAFGANAQQASFTDDHRFSLELSTGIPYPMLIHSHTDPEPGTAEYAEWMQMLNDGQSKAETMYPNLTLMFSWHIDRNWELSLFCNAHGYTYEIRQHPKGFTEGMNWGYDVNTVTEVLERGYKNMAIVPGAILKYYWYNRDFWKWYSGAGVGYFVYGEAPLFDTRVVPELILAGTHFGRRHLYGVAEFTLGPTGLGPQIGLGYRF